MENNQKGFSVLLAIVIVTAVALAGGGAYFYTTQIANQEAVPVPLGGHEDVPAAVNLNPSGVGVNVIPATEVDETAGWRTYSDNKYGFEIKYPQQYGITAGTIKLSETKKINIDTDYCCFPIPSPDKQSKLAINGVEFEKISGTITQNGFSQGVVSYRTSQNAQKKEMQIALIVDLGNVAVGTSGNAQIYDISKEPEAKIFDQILSTFKFVESQKGEDSGKLENASVCILQPYSQDNL